MRETSQALARAALLFAVPMDEDQLRVYLHVLSSSGASDIRMAKGVDAACLRCKFMPKPADILEYLPAVEDTQKALPAADDFEMSPDDRAFGLAAAPIFGKYVRKEITKDQMIAGFKAAAADLGISPAINWDKFTQGDRA
jgi:hypothetical protein